MKEFYSNRIILITGGAGTIGTELVFQIQKLKPKKIIILDNSEYAVHKLEHNSSYDNKVCEIILADIKNVTHLKVILSNQKPDIIIHAAAYKHLPILQKNPSEAILTNLMATKNLVNLAKENKVKKFLFISTDKAVCPSSVLGVSKYLAERFILSQETSTTKLKLYIVRFGNINKSSGSVVEIFEEQIKSNLPITVTDLEAERFFIDLKKACFLLLTSLTMNVDNGVFIFEMGEAVKIIDLAKKTLNRHNLELNKDVNIDITGLKEGEKLKETLFKKGDELWGTNHEEIFRVIEKSKSLFNMSDIDFLIDLSIDRDNSTLLQEISKIISR